MSHLALVGAGAMGGAIGARLAETGTALRVYDLDPAKVAPLKAYGATAAASAADAANGAAAVILSLNAPHIVRAAPGACAGSPCQKGPNAMITRYALFEGTIAPGQTEAFCQAVLAELLPTWQAFPGA